MKNVQCKNCAQLKADWCDKKMDSPSIDLVRDCQYFRQKTNIDLIQSMDVDDLAQFMVDQNLWACGLCPNHIIQWTEQMPLCNEPTCDRFCKEWLLKEVVA